MLFRVIKPVIVFYWKKIGHNQWESLNEYGDAVNYTINTDADLVNGVYYGLIEPVKEHVNFNFKQKPNALKTYTYDEIKKKTGKYCVASADFSNKPKLQVLDDGTVLWLNSAGQPRELADKSWTKYVFTEFKEIK